MISTGQKGDLPTRGLRRPACMQRPFSLRKRITRRFSFRMASRRRIVGRVLLFGGFPKKASRPGVDMNLVYYHALTLIGTTTFAPRHQAEAVRLVASGAFPLPTG